MNRRSPHLLPGQSAVRHAQLLAESPLEAWHDEVARGGIFTAEKLAAAAVVMMVFFSQLTFVADAAAARTDNYRDDFAAVAYDGSTGTIDWSTTPWIEMGEDDGPTVGRVQVVVDDGCPEGCLQLLPGGGAERAVDLSDTTDAQLAVALRTPGDDGDGAGNIARRDPAACHDWLQRRCRRSAGR